MRTFWLLLALMVLSAIISACSPVETPVVEPTQTLIPATETAIPSAVPPTATSSPPLLHPNNLASVTPEDNSNLSTPESTTDAASLDDPVAADLVAVAQRRVADELNLPVRRIQLIEVQFYTWADTSLGCPLPGEIYSQVTVDGYRIVLSAGDKQYIFHTDFDRALPCEATNEQLPAGVSS